MPDRMQPIVFGTEIQRVRRPLEFEQIARKYFEKVQFKHFRILEITLLAFDTRPRLQNHMQVGLTSQKFPK